MGWVIFFAVLAGFAAAPILIERRRDPVGEPQRRATTAMSVRLTGGVTSYRWHGPRSGPVAVLIHGLTTSSYVWDGLVPELTMMGYRVLTYDLFGRGLSDRPTSAQSRAFFMRQLRELLQDQGVSKPFTLVGYSMGGAIATVFAAEEPGRVERLVLLAPAGLTHRPSAFAEFCRRLPYLGDWLNTLLGGRMLRRALVPGPSLVPDITRRQAAETRTQGFLRSILSSQRYMLAERLDEEHGEIARNKTPVLAVWGQDDGVIPLVSLGQLAALNREARQVTVPGAGHGLPHTHPREIALALAEFRRES